MDYQRFTLSQRVQHIILVITFLLLVATGLPIEYRETWGKTWLEHIGFMNARSIHKWAAIGMIGVGVYHLLFYTLIDRGKKAIYPALNDIGSFFGVIKFRLGLSSEAPKFGRFNFWEKFSYWGAFWGFVIMIGSGLTLWFRGEFSFLPMWVRESARMAHAEEAVLAAVFILVFHLFYAHFRRGVFPMDSVFITGNVSEARMAEEHPLELERLKKGEVM